MTGGSSGIGRAICELLGRERARVIVTDVQDDHGEAVAAGIREAGGEAEFIHHDVAREESWEQVIAAVQARHHRLDVLVNNAGVSGGGRLIEEMSLDDWRACMAVNLDGAFLGVKYGILAMKRTGGGSIINVSSILGAVSVPRTANYSAAKAGVGLLTRAAALECSALRLNIRVNAVQPGFIDTPLVSDAIRARGPSMRRLIKRVQPGGQMGRPEDVAGSVLYLASDASRFVTGTELVVDGGIQARWVAGIPPVAMDVADVREAVDQGSASRSGRSPSQRGAEHGEGPVDREKPPAELGDVSGELGEADRKD